MKKSPEYCQPLGFFIAFVYLAISILGLITCIPLGVMLRNFQGVCPLWGQIVWDHHTIWPWLDETCTYTLFWTICADFIYGLIMFVTMMVLSCPRTRKHSNKVGHLQRHHITFVIYGMNNIFLIVNILTMLFQLGSAIIMTAGLAFFCQSLMERTSISSCADASSEIDWKKMRIINGDGMGINGYDFFGAYVFTSIISWIIFALWIVLLLINCKICCPPCDWTLPEEKIKGDKKLKIALQRSHLSTPGGGTPGHMTPRHVPPPAGYISGRGPEVSHGPLPPKA